MYSCMVCRVSVGANDVKFGFDDMGAAALYHLVRDGVSCGPLMDPGPVRPSWVELMDWMDTLSAAFPVGDFKTVDMVLRDFAEARRV